MHEPWIIIQFCRYMAVPSNLFSSLRVQSLLARAYLPQLRFMSSPKPKSRPPVLKLTKEKTLRLLKRSQVAEYKNQLQEEAKKVYCIKIARRDEPLNPEALNPARKRTPKVYTPEEIDEQITVRKNWSSFKNTQMAAAYRKLNAQLKSRMYALRMLKLYSPAHYEAAMKADLDVNLPIEYGPIPEFPPREGYVAPEPYDQLFPEEMAEQKEKDKLRPGI